jgi:hypothetical protein
MLDLTGLEILKYIGILFFACFAVAGLALLFQKWVLKGWDRRD